MYLLIKKLKFFCLQNINSIFNHWPINLSQTKEKNGSYLIILGVCLASDRHVTVIQIFAI